MTVIVDPRLQVMMLALSPKTAGVLTGLPAQYN